MPFATAIKEVTELDTLGLVLDSLTKLDDNSIDETALNEAINAIVVTPDESNLNEIGETVYNMILEASSVNREIREDIATKYEVFSEAVGKLSVTHHRDEIFKVTSRILGDVYHTISSSEEHAESLKQMNTLVTILARRIEAVRKLVSSHLLDETKFKDTFSTFGRRDRMNKAFILAVDSHFGILKELKEQSATAIAEIDKTRQDALRRESSIRLLFNVAGINALERSAKGVGGDFGQLTEDPDFAIEDIKK